MVETTNIHPSHGMREQTDKIVHSEDLRAIERFTRADDDTILYEFEIHDPRTYSAGVGRRSSLEEVRPADLRVRLS